MRLKSAMAMVSSGGARRTHRLQQRRRRQTATTPAAATRPSRSRTRRPPRSTSSTTCCRRPRPSSRPPTRASRSTCSPSRREQDQYFTKLALMNGSPDDGSRRDLRGHVPDPLRRRRRLPRCRSTTTWPSGTTGASSTRTPSRPASATTARPTASRWAPTPARIYFNKDDLRAGRPARRLAAGDLGRHPRGRRDRQGEGPGRHPAEHLRGQGGR